MGPGSAPSTPLRGADGLPGTTAGPTHRRHIRIIILLFFRIHDQLSLSRLTAEGRIAIVTTREAGMRWPREIAASSERRRGRTICRGREVAWSWHPDADAKLAGDDDPAGDGGQQARCTEESAYKREDRRAGNAGMPRLNLWYLPPAFFSQAGHGCGQRPAFPAPSAFSARATTMQASGRHAARARSRVLADRPRCLNREVRHTNRCRPGQARKARADPGPIRRSRNDGDEMSMTRLPQTAPWGMDPGVRRDDSGDCDDCPGSTVPSTRTRARRP